MPFLNCGGAFARQAVEIFHDDFPRHGEFDQ
jgi:hypothetical protein